MKLKNTRLKIVHFVIHFGRHSSPRDIIAYRIYGKQIVFTGLYNGSDGGRGSTINYAEDIVAAICRNERIEGREHTFYDLQTCTGYLGKYKPGYYRFNELCPRWRKNLKRPTDMAWIEGHCSDEVMKDFIEFIWRDFPVGTPRNLAVLCGAIQPIRPRPPEQKLIGN